MIRFYLQLRLSFPDAFWIIDFKNCNITSRKCCRIYLFHFLDSLSINGLLQHFAMKFMAERQTMTQTTLADMM